MITVRFARKAALIIVAVGLVMLLVAAIDFTYFVRNGGRVWGAIFGVILGVPTLAVGVRRLTHKFARVTPTSIDIQNGIVGSRTYPIDGLTDLQFIDETLYRASDGAKLATFKPSLADLGDFIRLGSKIMHAQAGAIVASREDRRPQP